MPGRATDRASGECAVMLTEGQRWKIRLHSHWVVIPGAVPVPIAAVGKAALDADGNVSGTESRSVGGGFADETFTGTYAVNPDCTGTTTLNFYESGVLVRTTVLSIVFDDHEREIRMVQKSLQLPNKAFLPVVITVEARRISTEDED